MLLANTWSEGRQSKAIIHDMQSRKEDRHMIQAMIYGRSLSRGSPRLAGASRTETFKPVWRPRMPANGNHGSTLRLHRTSPFALSKGLVSGL
jgi:hypothetical protein